jgi:hypothetical protein
MISRSSIHIKSIASAVAMAGEVSMSGAIAGAAAMAATFKA